MMMIHLWPPFQLHCMKPITNSPAPRSSKHHDISNHQCLLVQQLVQVDNKNTQISRFMGLTWGRQDPGGPHVGPMSLALWVHQSSILLVLCGGWPGDSFHKGPVMWKTFSCHNIIMTSRLFVACDSSLTYSEATDQGCQFDDSVRWSQCLVALLYKTRCRQKLFW